MKPDDLIPLRHMLDASLEAVSDYEVVEKTVKQDLPALIQQLRKLIDEYKSGNGATEC